MCSFAIFISPLHTVVITVLCVFYLNDIIQSINSNLDGIIHLDNIPMFLLLFADDAVLFSKNPNSLQSMLNDIETYCNDWNLNINVNKTKTVIFEKGRPTKFDFYMYNSKVEIVDSFKYLGVHLYKNGKWNRTQARISQHAAYSLHKLFIICNQLDLKVDMKNKLFDYLVLPILNYGAEIWGFNMAPSVENILKRFCRKILCVN